MPDLQECDEKQRDQHPLEQLVGLEESAALHTRCSQAPDECSLGRLVLELLPPWAAAVKARGVALAPQLLMPMPLRGARCPPCRCWPVTEAVASPRIGRCCDAADFRHDA